MASGGRGGRKAEPPQRARREEVAMGSGNSGNALSSVRSLRWRLEKQQLREEQPEVQLLETGRLFGSGGFRKKVKTTDVIREGTRAFITRD